MASTCFWFRYYSRWSKSDFSVCV